MKPLDPIGVPLQGTNLIEASAGTGKTYAITTLYLRCLLESKLAVEDLLVVTYTRAATSELRDRIRQRIHECWIAMSAGTSKDPTLQALIKKALAAGSVELDLKRLALALRSFDQAGIFTIHSFCQRCLTDSAFESGASFDSEFESDDQALADEIADDFWSREMYAIDPAQFAFLRESGLRIGGVRTLCRKAIADPDLTILPELGDVPECDLSSMHLLYARLRECWRQHGGGIGELLTRAKSSLSQQSFKPAQIASYVEAAEQFLTAEQARPIAKESKLLRLGTSFIASKERKGKVAPTHEFFDLVDAYHSECQSLAKHFERLALRLKLACVDYARSQSRQRKDQQEVLSFDDLLVRLRDALRAPGGERLAQAIASRYPLALIDEFQDTDPVQYEVFRRIYKAASGVGSALFLIGDPKQAIYGFRGADLFTYFNAREDARGRAHTLGTNYRSSPAMIAAVNALFSGARDSFLFPELQFVEVAPAPTATNLLVDPESQSRAFEMLVLEREGQGPSTIKRAQRHCTERVASEIVRLLSGDARIDSRPVVPADIAVLVRQNYQARAMQDALRALGVPSVLESSESVFLSEEAFELERVLSAMVDPGHRNAVKSALATSLLGYSGNAVHALQDDEVAWDRLLVQFQRWHATWVGRGFIQAFSQMLSDHKVGSRLLVRTDGQRKMTNLGQLGELLQARALAGGCGPQALLGWLRTMRLDPEARATAGDADQLRLESDDAAVKIVTVHKSKGLEYNIVFCPYVWAGGLQRPADKEWVRFHDDDDHHRLKLDIGSANKDEHMAQSAREALAEDLRLLYVALTRARHRCAIVIGVIKGFGSSGLAYLLFRDDNLQTDSASLQRFAEQLESLEDDELVRALTSKFAGGESGIGVRDLPAATARVLPAESGDKSVLRARPHTRLLTRAWRGASFSSLSRNADTEQDHDAHSNDAPALVQPSGEGEPVILAGFPKGAHPGQMLHHVFEHLDFWQAQPAAIEAQVRASLLAFGFDSERYAEAVSRAITRMLLTPLADGGFCLADVAAAQRLDELEFQFPVCEEGPGFSPTTLTSVLAERSDPPWPPRYLEALKNLGFAPLHGFLKGFIDMVFVHNERWYLVDYKSNFLGPYASDYQRQAMAQSMAEHHYFLQYHIYMVALDRYLRLRLPGYDYETHIGGVYYLYLRGMDADESERTGIFFDRPTAGDIARLDAALGARKAGTEC